MEITCYLTVYENPDKDLKDKTKVTRQPDKYMIIVC